MERSPHKNPEDAETGTDIELGKFEKKEKQDGYPKKPHRPYPGFRKNFYKYSAEYTNNTGIQGLKYIGEHERTFFERLWWFVLFCISLYICITLIIQTYIKWDTSPVLVSFARSPTPVSQIPFPAVTVCSETKARQTAYNFTEIVNRISVGPRNFTEEEMKKFADLSLVCENPYHFLYDEGDPTTGFDTIEFLMSIAPQFDEMLMACKYTILNDNCPDLFTPILTEEGLCYTFNMLDRSELFRHNVTILTKFPLVPVKSVVYGIC